MICVLALLIEPVAELACDKPWNQIRWALEKLQVTEFLDLKSRVLMRNELTPEVENIFKSLKIKPSKQVVQMTETA
jgi:hypothetical protein